MQIPNICSTNFPYAMVLNEKRPAKLISANGLQQISALCQPHVSIPSSQKGHMDFHLKKSGHLLILSHVVIVILAKSSIKPYVFKKKKSHDH